MLNTTDYDSQIAINFKIRHNLNVIGFKISLFKIDAFF